MPKRTRDYHSWLIKRLAEPREAERYLKVAMSDSPEMFLRALRNVAEAKKMAKVAEEAGVNRESLYKALSQAGNPAFFTVEAVLNAVGMTLRPHLKQPVIAGSGPGMPPARRVEQITTTTVLLSPPPSNVVSASLSGFPSVATIRNSLMLTSPTTTSPRAQFEWAYAGTFVPGFIGDVTRTDQSTISATGD